jgi:hypothetical protein
MTGKTVDVFHAPLCNVKLRLNPNNRPVEGLHRDGQRYWTAEKCSLNTANLASTHPNTRRSTPRFPSHLSHAEAKTSPEIYASVPLSVKHSGSSLSMWYAPFAAEHPQEKYGADMARLRRIFCFLACLCPKPDGELCCCSLPVNDGLLMIDTPEFVRICRLTYETQGEGTRVEQAPPLRGL